METLQRIPMSWEEYLDAPEHPRSEWVDGTSVVSPLASPDHQWIVGLLTELFRRSLPAAAVYPGTNQRLPRNRVRIPDVVVYRERVHAVIVDDIPLAVVEVLSPSTRAEDTIRKPREYAEGGIGQCWIVDPELRRIDVFANVGGEWETILHLDDATPVGSVAVEEYGEVAVDLRELFA